MKKELKQFSKWLAKEDRQNWEIERYVEALLEPERKLMSVSEYARMKGISRQAVLKQIKKGKLKAEKVGRSYVIFKELISKEEKEEKIEAKLKMIKTMKCPKGHELRWVLFAEYDYDIRSGKLSGLVSSDGVTPPHGLLFCSKCGYSYLQVPIYLDRDGNIIIPLDVLPDYYQSDGKIVKKVINRLFQKRSKTKSNRNKRFFLRVYENRTYRNP